MAASTMLDLPTLASLMPTVVEQDGKLRDTHFARGLPVLGADVAHREPPRQAAATADVPEHVRVEARWLAQGGAGGVDGYARWMFSLLRSSRSLTAFAIVSRLWVRIQ
jgi:hypothetical protein